MELAKPSISADRSGVAESEIAADGADGRPSIAIVDDDDGARRSMACLLESDGYRALPFRSGDEFLRAGPPNDLTCVLLDICMPGRSGLDVLRELVHRSWTTPVIMVTGQADIRRAVEAMKLHAFDLIEKPCNPDAVLRAVTRAEAVVRDADAARQARHQARTLVAHLTDRQQQVLRGIVRGDANKIIAWKLGLSVRTVEAYRAQLLERLRVRSSIEAVRIAMAAGMDGS